MHSDNAVAPPPPGVPADDAPPVPTPPPDFQLPLRPGPRPEVVAGSAAGIAGLLCSTWAAVTAGAAAAGGAALGTVLVIGFFAAGRVPLVLARTPGGRGGAGFGFLFLNYVFRLVLVLVVLRLLRRSTGVHVQWLGATVVIATLAWTTAHVWTVVRSSRTL